MADHVQEAHLKLRSWVFFVWILRFGVSHDNGESWPELVWLHIPKTGTSFVRTLWATHCPKLITCDVLSTSIIGDTTAIHTGHGLAPNGMLWKNAFENACRFHNPRTHLVYSWGNHIPWNRKYAPYGVTLIRDPFDRLLSAFLFAGGHLDPAPRNTTALRKWWSGNITRYAQYIGALGCQTKEVAGNGCTEPLRITSSYVERAIEILQTDFKFVGLTEEYILSVKLYHKMFGEGEPCEAESFNFRPGENYKTTLSETARRDIIENNLLEHEPDVFLHKAAKKIFWERVCSYNLDPRCANHSLRPDPIEHHIGGS